MTIKTIVWDIDGVLIWHHPTDPSKDWREKLMHSDVLGLWEAFQNSPGWQLCLRDKNVNTRMRFQHYLQGNNMTVHEDTNHIIDIWLSDNVMPNKLAIKRLREFQDQGYQCVLGTNQDGLRKPYIERWLDAQGLGTLPLYMSCDMGCAKPDSAFYARIEEDLGCASDEIILLDDTLKNIEGAKAKGWSAIHIADAYKTDSAHWGSISLETL